MSQCRNVGFRKKIANLSQCRNVAMVILKLTLRVAMSHCRNVAMPQSWFQKKHCDFVAMSHCRNATILGDADLWTSSHFYQFISKGN